MTCTTVPWVTPSSASMITCVFGSLPTALTNRFRRSASCTAVPATMMAPAFVIDTTSDLAAGSTSLVAPLGRLTFTPARDAVSTMTLDVTMKMMSSTRKMSVSGVMLISAKIAPSPTSSSGSLPSAILALRAGPQRLQELLGQDLQLDGDARQPLVEVVVDDDGLDRDRDARGGGDERLGDALRHDGEAAAAVLRDGAERGHDADDGPVEADEGRG